MEGVLEEGSMVKSLFCVLEMDGRSGVRECTATRIGPLGIEVEASTAPVGRFTWLEFVVPGTDYRVKALAEVIACIAAGGVIRTIMRFKHLFPRDRARLSAWFVETKAAA